MRLSGDHPDLSRKGSSTAELLNPSVRNQGRVRTLPLCESSRDDVIQSIAQFLSPRNPFQVRTALFDHKHYALGCTVLLVLTAAYLSKLAA